MRTLLAIAWLAAALPATAQQAPGIDLSEPPKGKQSEPGREDATELPPIDLSKPPEARAPAEKPEELPVRPFSEKDVALGDKVKAVQRKGFLKRGRFEVAPIFAATVNDPFYTKFGGALRLAYNLQDSFAVAVRGTYYEPYRTDNVREGKLAFRSQLLASQIEKQVMLGGIWSPVYGKASFLQSKIVHFDLFLSGGFGLVWTATSAAPRNDGPGPGHSKFATEVGGGVRFYPKDWLAFELGLLGTLYPDQPVESLPATIQKVFVANVGVSFFFPTSFEYVYP